MWCADAVESVGQAVAAAVVEVVDSSGCVEAVLRSCTAVDSGVPGTAAVVAAVVVG